MTISYGRAKLKATIDSWQHVSSVDPEIAELLRREAERQQNTLDLIASENYTSPAILAAQSSTLTNKYAEGYPHRRYYGGCEEIDRVEILAIERAQKLFFAEHANVQPHSGSQANMAAYFTLLEPGDKVLAMKLSHGGHLSHGAEFNFSGKLYRFVFYGVNRESEQLDYQEIRKLAQEQRPNLIVAGASSYPRIIDFGSFQEIAAEVGAKLMVDMAHLAGLVAAQVHPSPVPYADVVTATTHKTLRGPRSGFILCKKPLAHAIDAAVFPETQGGPLMHVIAAKAVAFAEALDGRFREYQQRVLENARVLAQSLQELGLRLVSGGTDTHMVLIDLTSTGLTGKEAEEMLGAVGISINRNVIPFDPRPPQVASGMRLGTPAITTRGLDPQEVRHLAQLIYQALSHSRGTKVLGRLRQEVEEICQRFPIPGYSLV